MQDRVAVAPPHVTGTVSVLHDLASNCGKSSDAVVDICCVIGVPPPIVTAPADDTWNCPCRPYRQRRRVELLPMRNCAREQRHACRAVVRKQAHRMIGSGPDLCVHRGPIRRSQRRLHRPTVKVHVRG